MATESDFATQIYSRSLYDHFGRKSEIDHFWLISLWFAFESSFDKNLKKSILAILRGLDIVRILTNLSSEKSWEQIWPRSHSSLKNWTKLYFYVSLPDPSKWRFWPPKGYTLQNSQILNFDQNHYDLPMSPFLTKIWKSQFWPFWGVWISYVS